MREYVRQKRWRERERLQVNALDSSTSSAKRPIQRMKLRNGSGYVRRALRPASSKERQELRRPARDDAESGITKQQHVAVSSVDGHNESVDSSEARGMESLDSMRRPGLDKDLATSLTVRSTGGGEKGNILLRDSKDIERTH
jgi:hypothetical protein